VSSRRFLHKVDSHFPSWAARTRRRPRQLFELVEPATFRWQEVGVFSDTARKKFVPLPGGISSQARLASGIQSKLGMRFAEVKCIPDKTQGMAPRHRQKWFMCREEFVVPLHGFAAGKSHIPRPYVARVGLSFKRLHRLLQSSGCSLHFPSPRTHDRKAHGMRASTLRTYFFRHYPGPILYGHDDLIL